MGVILDWYESRACPHCERGFRECLGSLSAGRLCGARVMKPRQFRPVSTWVEPVYDAMLDFERRKQTQQRRGRESRVLN